RQLERHHAFRHIGVDAVSGAQAPGFDLAVADAERGLHGAAAHGHADGGVAQEGAGITADARAGVVAVAGAGPVVADRPAGPGGVDIPAGALAEGFVASGGQLVQIRTDAQGGARLGRAAVASDADADVGRQGDVQTRGGAAKGLSPAARVGDVVVFRVPTGAIQRAWRNGGAVGAADDAFGAQTHAVVEISAGEPDVAFGHDAGRRRVTARRRRSPAGLDVEDGGV